MHAPKLYLTREEQMMLDKAISDDIETGMHPDLLEDVESNDESPE